MYIRVNTNTADVLKPNWQPKMSSMVSFDANRRPKIQMLKKKKEKKKSSTYDVWMWSHNHVHLANMNLTTCYIHVTLPRVTSQPITYKKINRFKLTRFKATHSPTELVLPQHPIFAKLQSCKRVCEITAQ